MNPIINVTTFVAALLLLGVTAQGEENSLVAPGAKLQKLAGDFKFTEGATCDPHGNVFFVDQPNNRILKWDVGQSKLSTFMDPAGRANGMCFDATGNLIACADETNALWSIAPDKQVNVLAFSYQGKPLNGPNDVWIHPNGSMYLTDPYYQRTWWTHTKPPQDGEQVYRLSADRKTLTRVTDDLVQPNGITGPPDGKMLYVADIGAHKTYTFDIQKDGSLTNKRLFCELGSDGMTLDTDGNVYLTGRGVIIFDQTGKRIETIPVPERWVGNLCFGGKDQQTLFIAASEGFYSIRMRTKGANPAK